MTSTNVTLVQLKLESSESGRLVSYVLSVPFPHPSIRKEEQASLPIYACRRMACGVRWQQRAVTRQASLGAGDAFINVGGVSLQDSPCGVLPCFFRVLSCLARGMWCEADVCGNGWWASWSTWAEMVVEGGVGLRA